MELSSVEQIERAIDTLSPPELEELWEWVERRQLAVDARIQSDLAAGRFDEAIEQALQDEKHGRLRPL